MAITRVVPHVRSFSWPAESHHPNSSINDLLLGLQDLEVGPNSSSKSSICHHLCAIKDLYHAINNSVEHPLNQQVLKFDKHRCELEEALEDSLVVLDACGSTMDILCLMMESILELESSLRRKSGGEENGISAYKLARKKMQKRANKCLKHLQSVNVGLAEDNNHLVPLLRMLNKAQTISLSTLIYLVPYISSAKTKGTGHSLVANLMHFKRTSCEKLGETSKMEKIDQALLAAQANKCIMNAERVLNMLLQLKALEFAVQEIEDCLESVSRCVLKTRVSLLNIFSH